MEVLEAHFQELGFLNQKATTQSEGGVVSKQRFDIYKKIGYLIQNDTIMLIKKKTANKNW